MEPTLPDGCVSIRCVDISKITFNSDDDIHTFFDTITAAQPGDREELEQIFGIKGDPGGILADRWLRSIYKPISHNLRDWMHMLVSGGCANTIAAQMINALGAHHIKLDHISAFIESWTLPHRHGKADGKWVARKRLGKKRDSLGSFAGIMLTLMPILSCFLDEVIDDSHPLHEKATCFKQLNQIIGILSFGPDHVMAYIDVLRTLIRDWAALFCRVFAFNCVKPKFHHFVIHCLDDAVRVGKLLSCFVTERKHRQTKRSALFTFRSIDNAVAKDMLHRQCESFRDNDGALFSRRQIVRPKYISMGDARFGYSNTAVLPCGSLFSNDVLWTSRGNVGKLIRFWSTSANDSLVAQIELYSPADDSGTRWDISSPAVHFIDTEQIIDAVIWGVLSDSIIRVIKPAKVCIE